jgi:Tfp pilus assembly protein PilO
MLVVIIALAALGGFSYVVSYISGLSQKTSDIKSDIESKQIKINHIQNVNKSAEKTSEDGIKIVNYFIKSDGVIDFVSSVESTAGDFSLKYNTTSIDNAGNDVLAAQGKDLLKMSMTLSGSWKNILRFLTYIESLPYAVRVERVELSSSAASAVVASANDSSSVSSSSSAKSVKAKVSTPDSIWNLSIAFSVVKIKDKK